MFKRNDIANLNNILWAIDKIENSTKNINSPKDLQENEEKYDSIIVKLMNIGESANNLSEELKQKFDKIDWDGMYKMRNIITHSYHNVSLKLVWDIIKNELPNDKIEVQNLLNIIQSKSSNS